MPEIQESHAEECVRLANLSRDDVVRAELLKLRQGFLRSAERLRALIQPKDRK
ncbi:MAG TPA: hypothetical protein VLT91_08295 [Rhizomicrobium sp.]|nr:hypothetical protein [Rhizomicrobium sp.]